MRRIIYFIVVFLLWLLLTCTLNWQNILVGIGVGIISTIIFGHKFINSPQKCFQIKRYFWLFNYLLVFLWECIKANFDVAYRVLSPKMPIKPGIVKVSTSLKSDMAKTFLANSITMTPGTLSVDIKGRFLYIHWIYVKSEKVEEATEIIVDKFENLLKRIFE